MKRWIHASTSFRNKAQARELVKTFLNDLGFKNISIITLLATTMQESDER